MSTYLDYNASAPIDLRVLDCMIDIYKNYIGNADSRTHDYGEKARKIVEDARKQVASLLGIALLLHQLRIKQCLKRQNIFLPMDLM